MSDFFSGLVDRAVGRAPMIDSRIPPRFEPPRGKGPSVGLAEDAHAEIDEIIAQTSQLAIAPPHRRKAIEPQDDAPTVQSKLSAPVSKEKTQPVREPRVEPKAAAQPPRAIAKVEKIIEPPIAPRTQPPVQKPSTIETRVAKSPTLVASREIAKPPQQSKSVPASPAREQNPISPASARATAQPVIRPKVTPRAPQVIVQREPSPAPTIQVTIGRIEVRAASGASSSSSAAPRPAGPKLNLEDYLKNRAGGSR